MHTIARPFFGLLAATLALVALGPPASADGQGCAPPVPGRPPCTVLRPPAGTGRTTVDPAAPECVVFVGGLGSPRTDGFFDPIIDALDRTADGRAFESYRFGSDRGEAYPYRTLGSIDQSARDLRRLVLDLSDECFAIDVVTHSMGGVVADRAFALGLSAGDGVAAYLPLSGPHNGAFVARAIRLGVELDDAYASALGGLLRALPLGDPTRDAVRDLAHTTAPRVPRGVATVRQRLVTDVTVLRRDNADRRVDVRERLPRSVAGYDGHGGIVRDPEVQDVVTTTLRTHVVPPDGRTAAEIGAAGVASRLVDRYWAGLVGSAGLGLAAVSTGYGAGEAFRGGGGPLGSRLLERADVIAEMVLAANDLGRPPLRAVLDAIFWTAVDELRE